MYKRQLLDAVLSAVNPALARIVDEEVTDEERRGLEGFARSNIPKDIAQWIGGV